MENIIYSIEPGLPPYEFISVLVDSTLGERRPVNDPVRIKAMLDNADIIVTARVNGKLIGVSRAVSDFAFCTYLSDLAVHKDYQHKGIGKELIRQTKIAAPSGKLILLAAPAAVSYYPRIGMTKHEHCYYIDNPEEIH
jgi:GNAT superfamily N-acetyltransferase